MSPLELATAYTTLANGGRRVVPRGIEAVVDRQGRSLGPVGAAPEPVIEPALAYLVTDLLRGVVERGTARSAARLGFAGEAAGKTGSSDGLRDAWFVGYTPNVVVAVWVGFDKGKSLGLTGAQAALPIWARFVSASGRDDVDGMAPPDSVVEVPICTASGEPASEACPESAPAWFAERADEEGLCSLHDDGLFSGTRSIINQLREKLRPVRQLLAGLVESDDPGALAGQEARPLRAAAAELEHVAAARLAEDLQLGLRQRPGAPGEGLPVQLGRAVLSLVVLGDRVPARTVLAGVVAASHRAQHA